MPINSKPNRSGNVSQASVTNIESRISRKIGNMRAVATENGSTSLDRIFPAPSAVQEVIEEVFGTFTDDAQSKANKKIYQFKDRMPNAVGKFKKAAR